MHLNQFQNEEPDDSLLLLKDALHQVPVPADLADRIKSLVQREALGQSAGPQLLSDIKLATGTTRSNYANVPVDVVPVEIANSARSTERRISRRTLIGCTAAAGLIGMGTGACFYFAGQPLEQSVLAMYCMDRIDEFERRHHPWVRLEDAQKSNLIKDIRPLPSQWLTEVCILPGNAYIRRSRAYRLDPKNGIGLILFDLTMSHVVRNLNQSFSPMSAGSGGWSLVGMQERRRVFVVAGACKEPMLLSLVGASPAV